MTQLRIMKAPSEMVSPEDLGTLIGSGTPMDSWYLSRKLDGYHCIIKHDGIFSSSMKTGTFRNKKLLKALESTQNWARLNGMVLCGELYDPMGSFEDLGALRATDGPLSPTLRFHVFDMLTEEDWEDPKEPFGFRQIRILDLQRDQEAGLLPPSMNIVVCLYQRYVLSGMGYIARQSVTDWINRGEEGAVLHHADAVYKHGRVTRKDARLLKVKAFDWHDAVIIGVEEGLKTPEGLERKVGPTGHKEPVAKGQKVPSGSFGRFKVQVRGGPFDRAITYIGRWKGWTQEMADEIWACPYEWVGQWIRFESMHGAKTLPRIPKNVTFRDPK